MGNPLDTRLKQANNTDFTHSVVDKSAFESKMFSDKRITLEGMMEITNPRLYSTKNDNLAAIYELPEQENKTKQKNDNPELGILTLLKEKDINDYRKKDLGEPTGRREVELLNEWLDKMLQDHVFSQTNMKKDPDVRKKALYNAKLILSICIRDLIRQVSVQCLERGVLIEKVLNNYINIFETETRGNMYDLDEIQSKHLKDILKLKAEIARNSNKK